jgi:broad specificity phosphatase PhoE
MKLAFAIAAAALFANAPFDSRAQLSGVTHPPVVILVRHADKAAEPADDPPLTQSGAQRAQALAATLRSAGVTAIVTTQMRRTRETAQPLATALGLTPEVVEVDAAALVANPAPGARFPPEVLKARDDYIKKLEPVIRRHSGVVLVVGHDWSVPGLIASFGGPQMPNICSSVYDNLFILTPYDGKPNLIRARYGAATPDTNCK